MVAAAVRDGTPPPPWSRPTFAERVQAVRRQLAPLGSQRLLEASFAREALHAHPVVEPPTAVRVAYAIRWIELTLGPDLPAWPPVVVDPSCGPRGVGVHRPFTGAIYRRPATHHRGRP